MSEEIEKKLWKRARFFVSFLQVVPFVRMVAVCNNLSFGKVDEDSDIDLFIVARKGRLFVVRTLVTLIFQLLAVRRHGKKVSGRFCLSFFIDDSQTDLSPLALERDVYLAYWIFHLKPLIDDGFSQEFINANGWCAQYYTVLPELDYSHSLRPKLWHRSLRALNHFFFAFLWGDLAELILSKWQLARANKKAAVAGPEAHLVITKNILKFHNLDRRAMYRRKWFDRYGEDATLSTNKFLNII